MKKIKCNSIDYRKGFLEVSYNVHDAYINLEVWNIHPDTDISGESTEFEDISEELFTGNTEIEMSIDEAEQLLKKLKECIDSYRK
ncbi:MAG: hypothetical protein ABW176_15450 [Candidatus Thiodiazotropha endolucinida]